MEFRSNVTGRNPLQQRHHCVLISPVVGLLFDFIYLSLDTGRKLGRPRVTLQHCDHLRH